MAKRPVLLTRPAYAGAGFARADHQNKTGGGDPLPLPLSKRGEEGRGADRIENPLDRILEEAKSLSAADRRKLLDHLALVSKEAEDASPRDVEMWVVAVYEELVRVLGVGDGASVGPVIVKRALSPRAAWAPVQGFMANKAFEGLQAIERQSIYRLLATLLVRHARSVSSRSGAPLSPKLVANCTGNVAGLFDQAFPGYLRAGLGRVIVRQLIKGQVAA